MTMEKVEGRICIRCFGFIQTGGFLLNGHNKGGFSRCFVPIRQAASRNGFHFLEKFHKFLFFNVIEQQIMTRKKTKRLIILN